MLDRISLTMRDAALRPASWNADTLSVEAVIASNAPVARRDAQGEYLEILDVNGADLSALIGASVLDGHRQDGISSVIGTVEAARVEGGEVIGRLRMSSRPELAPIVRDISDGVIRHLSVGYSVEQWMDGTAGGKRTRTAAKWTPREVSFVAVPADRNAHTRNDSMNERVTINRQIRELASRAGVTAAITNEIIDRQLTVEEARQIVLDDVIRRGSIAIMPSRPSFDDPAFFRDAVTDALYTRIAPSHKPSEAARQYVGMSLVEIARLTLQRSGVSTAGLGPDSLITRALEGAGTTSDYANIMANVLDKSLRVAYESAPSGLKEVARQTTAADFRSKMRVLLDSTGMTLEAVNEAGEFKSGSMIDAAESYAVSTFGKIFSITRKLIVNDDLNAMGDISRRLGIAAAQFEATALANLLLSNSGAGPTMGDDFKDSLPFRPQQSRQHWCRAVSNDPYRRKALYAQADRQGRRADFRDAFDPYCFCGSGDGWRATNRRDPTDFG